MSDIHSPFNDPQAVRSYADRTAHLVPGFTDMQRMAMLLLAEHASEDAQVLVVGAGGGLELKLFAQAHPGWRFVGVDPSREMLQLARTTLGVLAERVHFHEALVESASAGPFDVAACLLTLHFLPDAERLATLTAHALYAGNSNSAPTALAVGNTNTVLHGSTGATRCCGFHGLRPVPAARCGGG